MNLCLFCHIRWFQNVNATEFSRWSGGIISCKLRLHLCTFCTHCLNHRGSIVGVDNSDHRRSQDFVWGVHFFCQKSLRPFFSRRPQRPSKYISKSNLPSKNCPKNWLLRLAGGALRVLGVHLHFFPLNYAWKKFLHRPGVAGAPTAPPVYACALDPGHFGPMTFRQ